MLLLTKGTTSNIVVTLTEKVSGSLTHYLFVFTNKQTAKIVTVIKALADDLSLYTSRYNEFSIASTVFENELHGMWSYKVYQQSSAVNTDPALAGTLLETGFLRLLPATAFEYETYSDNEGEVFKAYNG
jgi:hypothetical protein